MTEYRKRMAAVLSVLSFKPQTAEKIAERVSKLLERNVERLTVYKDLEAYREQGIAERIIGGWVLL